MEPQRSSCGCKSFSSFTKQHPLCIYGHRRASKKYIFFNHIDKKKLSTFSFNDDLKLTENNNKVFKDEIYESGDQNPEKSTETPYLVSCESTSDKYFSLTSSLKTLTKSAAELSAQIMNIPFKDKKILSWQEFASQASISKLNLFHIFEKIKDVYKACSCKVSECIVRKPRHSETYDPQKCGNVNNYKGKVNVASTFRSSKVGDGSDTLRLEQELKQKYDFNCAECSRRYDVNKNLWHEMSMGIPRPLGCICETCLNVPSLPTGTNTCSCENCHKVMGKSVQRETDYDNRVDRGQLDLMSMIAALSKINLSSHNRSQVKKCSCQNKYSCYNNKKDSASAADSSNFTTDNEYIRNGAMISLLEREFVTKKSCLKTTQATPSYKNHERFSEIKSNSCFYSKSNSCKRSSQWRNYGVIMTTYTCYNCHCTHYECERCNSKNDATNKKEIKRTPATFRNKINRSFITLHDEGNQNTDDYPRKQTYPSLSEDYFTMNFLNDDLVDECDENPHMNFPDIEQQLCQKLTAKSKKKLQNQPFLYPSSIKRYLNINGTVKLQASSSNIFSDYTISRQMNSENNSQTDNKYENKKCNSSRSIYLTPFRKKTATFLSDFINLDKFGDNKHKKLNTHSKNTYDNVNVFSNCNKHFAKNVFGKHATSSRSTNYNERNSSIIRKCYLVKDVQPINESSQCNIIERRDRLGVTQIANENNMLFSKLQEYCKQAVHYSNCVEKTHKATIEIDSKEVENLPNLNTRNKFNIVEDYNRSQKTIKDAQIFSLHLKSLLDTYEKANREFESVSCKLTHFIQTLQRGVSCIENVGRESKEKLMLESSGENVTTTDSFDYTKDFNANTLLFDSRHRRFNSENRLDIHLESILSSKSTDDWNPIRYIEEKTESIRDSKKLKLKETKITEHLEKVNDKVANVNPKQKKLSYKINFSPNCNDHAIIEFKKDTSITFSFYKSDITDDSSNCQKKLYPIVETNVPKNIHLQYLVKKSNIKKQFKRYTKTCRQAIVGSNRKKLSVPKLAKWSTITGTLEDVDQINKNEKVIDKLIKTNESKLSIAVTESDVSENVTAETTLTI